MTLNIKILFSENHFYFGIVTNQVFQGFYHWGGNRLTSFLQNSELDNVIQRRIDLHFIIPCDPEIIVRTQSLVDAAAKVSSLTAKLKKPPYRGEGDELWNGMRGSRQSRRRVWNGPFRAGRKWAWDGASSYEKDTGKGKSERNTLGKRGENNGWEEGTDEKSMR